MDETMKHTNITFTKIPSHSLPSDEDMTTTSFPSSTLFFRDFLLCGPCRSINIS